MVGFRQRSNQSGNTILELALVMTPLMALLLSIVEVSLPIFKKSTFTAAVREGCRYAITYQTNFNGTNYASQSDAIKAVVQANTMGFLDGPSGLSKINVDYYLPTSPFSKVTGNSNANADGNIVEVSVTGYTHSWMVPILWFYGPTRFQVTTTALNIAAVSADRLETLPPGTARPTP